MFNRHVDALRAFWNSLARRLFSRPCPTPREARTKAGEEVRASPFGKAMRAVEQVSVEAPSGIEIANESSKKGGRSGSVSCTSSTVSTGSLARSSVTGASPSRPRTRAPRTPRPPHGGRTSCQLPRPFVFARSNVGVSIFPLIIEFQILVIMKNEKLSNKML